MSFKHLINRVANVLYVNFRYSAYLKFQFKPNNDIRLCREKKLKTILKIAVNKVPFYKPYKSEIDFNNFSLKELNKLPIVEKKKSNYLSYRSKVWQSTSRGGLPKLFFEKLDFEKYVLFTSRLTRNRQIEVLMEYRQLQC